MIIDKKEAIKLLLKRYDILSTWKFVFRPLLYRVAIPFIYSVTTIYILISIFVFSKGSIVESILGHFYKKVVLLSLYFFSNHSMACVWILTFMILCGFFIRDNVFDLKIQKQKIIKNLKGEIWAIKEGYGLLFIVKSRPGVALKKLLGLLVIFIFLGCLTSWLVFFYIIIAFFLVLIFIRREYFIISVFLPRIIISVTYLWATYILTEENTRLFYALPAGTYLFIFLVSLFGTIIFLYFEAKQYSPSTNWENLLKRRVLPVFSFTVTIAIVFGLIVNSLLIDKRSKQAQTIQLNFLADSLAINSKLQDCIKTYSEHIERIRSDYHNLPVIPLETKLQSLTNSGFYSRRYNFGIDMLLNKVQFCLLSLKLDSALLKSTDSAYYKRTYESIGKFGLSHLSVARRFQRQLRQQDSIFEMNQVRLESLITSLTELADRIVAIYSMRKARYDDIDHLYDSESGYVFFKGKKCDTIELNRLVNCNKDDVLYTQFPISVYSNSEKNTINLKSFLIQVAIAIALGVIGQLIISDKTATEAL
ncbi:MAG: hypothetical protein NT040_10555 [Bacteroidetes bacterium]|nr:hypothetical protein [Bacteroidota bacterium]